MKRGACPSCWFSGLTPVDDNPHGRLRGTCMLWGARRRGGCAAWQKDGDAAPPLQTIRDAKAEHWDARP